MNDTAPPLHDFSDGLLYCKSRALDEAARALARRFQSRREGEGAEQQQVQLNISIEKDENQKRGRETSLARTQPLHSATADAVAAAATRNAADITGCAGRGIPPSLFQPSPFQPAFVRHAEASKVIAARGAGWETAAELLLAEDAAAVAAFVRAEVAAVIDAARTLENTARKHARRDDDDQGGVASEFATVTPSQAPDMWWHAADDLAGRAEAASALLSHNVEAMEYVLAGWAADTVTATVEAAKATVPFSGEDSSGGKSKNASAASSAAAGVNDVNADGNSVSRSSGSDAGDTSEEGHQVSSMSTSSSSSFSTNVTPSPASPSPAPIAQSSTNLPPSPPPPPSLSSSPPLSRAADTLCTLTSVHVDFEAAALGLSAAYAALRARELEDPTGGDDAAGDVEWTPPSSFERKTTKYWVQPGDVLRLKLAIAKHLPVLVYNGGGGGGGEGGGGDEVVVVGGGGVAGGGDAKREKQSAASAVAAVAIAGKSTSKAKAAAARVGRDGGMITSVYFDNPALDVYHTRLERQQGATLVRARWYGDNPDLSGVHGRREDEEKEEEEEEGGVHRKYTTGKRSEEGRDVGNVFIERKTHHESWSLYGSVKERFRLDRHQLAGYLSGRLDVPARLRSTGSEEDDKAATLAEEVMEWELRGRGLSPSLRWG